jgi:hypothetical protein
LAADDGRLAVAIKDTPRTPNEQDTGNHRECSCGCAYQIVANVALSCLLQLEQNIPSRAAKDNRATNNETPTHNDQR